MDPYQIAQLCLGIGATLAEAYNRHQAAQDALQKMLVENRGPSDEEKRILREAGANVDARLDALLS